MLRLGIDLPKKRRMRRTPADEAGEMLNRAKRGRAKKAGKEALLDKSLKAKACYPGIGKTVKETSQGVYSFTEHIPEFFRGESGGSRL